MSERRAEVHLGVRAAPAMTSQPLGEDPFNIAVLGDFGGRGNRSESEDPEALAGRRPIVVDRDNYDTVLARFAPALRIPLTPDSSTRALVRFSCLDDFHPDSLFERLPVFHALRATRDRLRDPETFAGIQRELAGGDAARAGDPPPASVPENLLDQIVEEAGGGAPPASSDMQAYLRSIVAPHLVPDVDPRQQEMLAALDASIADQMRALLHHPDLQALEALWRGVFFLVRRLETGTELKVSLVDVTREELADDQTSSRPLERSALYRLLVDGSVGTPGAPRWAVFLGAYAFGAGMDDVKLLARLGAIGMLAEAPWISAAAPSVVGCTSFGDPGDAAAWRAEPDDAWAALRMTPQARSLGLALPRFLLRLPYGSASDPCDVLSFEEFRDAAPRHEDYLWGNPAFVCAYVLGKAFEAGGWALDPGRYAEIDRLPFHLVQRDGETMAQPCAEMLLTERAASHILDRGVMALASLKDRDAVRLVRLQSVADPPCALAGRW